MSHSATQTTPIVLASGEAALVLSTDGDKTTLRTPRAFPHGSTVSGVVDGGGPAFQLKVHRCKQEGDSFRVDGRIRAASRELKRALGVPTREESAS